MGKHYNIANTTPSLRAAVYRYGELRDCSEKSADWRFCMRTKTVGPIARKVRKPQLPLSLSLRFLFPVVARRVANGYVPQLERRKEDEYGANMCFKIIVGR